MNNYGTRCQQAPYGLHSQIVKQNTHTCSPPPRHRSWRRPAETTAQRHCLFTRSELETTERNPGLSSHSSFPPLSSSRLKSTSPTQLTITHASINSHHHSHLKLSPNVALWISNRDLHRRLIIERRLRGLSRVPSRC